jgi:hypothetical protein
LLVISGPNASLGLLLVAALSANACAAPAPATRVIPMRSYVLGTLGDREVDVRDICGPRKARGLAVAPSLGSVALGILSLGFYTPRELRVECADAR